MGPGYKYASKIVFGGFGAVGVSKMTDDQNNRVWYEREKAGED
jgi:hypothetical protein